MNGRAHTVFFIAFAIFAVALVFFFINNYLSRIRASTTKAFVSFPPGSILISAEQPLGSIDSNRISAFDLTISATGQEQITALGSPVTYPGGDSSIFTPVIVPQTLPSTQVRLAYVIQQPTANLPVALSIPVTTSSGGAVTFVAGATQEIVGVIVNATDNIYQIVTTTPTVGVPTATATVVPPLPITRPRAIVSFPASSTYTQGQSRTDTIFILADQPVGGIATNRISAFSLTIKAVGMAQITGVGAPSTYPGGDSSIFTPVIVPSVFPANQVRIAYIIQRPTADLPTGIQLLITTSGTGTGAGSLTLDTSATQEVVGVIGTGTDNTYEVVIGTYGSSGTPTPPAPTQSPVAPTITTTTTPHPSGTGAPCTKEKGDSDCDGDTDDDDYQKWKDQYDDMPDRKNKDNPNFDCREEDKKSHFVDMKDFEVWRRWRWWRR